MGNIQATCSPNNNDADKEVSLELGLKDENFNKKKQKYIKGYKKIVFYHDTPEGRTARNDLDSIFFE